MYKNLNNTGKISGLLAGYVRTWGLRKKILLSMLALLLLLGLTTTLITQAILLKVLKAEFQHKGLSLTRSIAANSVVDILTRNTSRLKKLVENEKSLDSSIAYVFIIDSTGYNLAHTFNKGFPVDLSKINSIPEGIDFNIQTLDTKMGLIYDIAVPIFSEKSLIGQARLGILQNSIQRTINAINLIFMGVTFLIIIMGAFLAYRISSLITSPISRLVEATQTIQRGNFSTHIDVETKDEIGLLASAFNEMSLRLNQMVDEIKRLTMFEERNRIGLDLHDGCAQDLANIIKRIELCEKLLKIEPMKAIEELRILRENTKEILNKTRQVIFDLKSPEDDDFDLMNKLTTYIKDYETSNDITVKLNISGQLSNIPLEKAKPIFYIMTEAFTNIKKHAQAKNVELSLESDSKHNLKININDDGKGFNISATKLSTLKLGRWGLISMRQRAAALGGALIINSMPNQGTEIAVNIPLGEKV